MTLNKCYSHVLSTNVKDEIQEEFLNMLKSLNYDEKNELIEFICREDKHIFLERFNEPLLKQYKSMDNNEYREWNRRFDRPISLSNMLILIKICILCNSINCFKFFYKLFPVKIKLIDGSGLSDSYGNIHNIEISNEEIKIINNEMLYQCFLQTKSLKTEIGNDMFCQNVVIIILELLKRREKSIEMIDKLFSKIEYNLTTLRGSFLPNIFNTLNSILLNDKEILTILKLLSNFEKEIIDGLIINNKVSTIYYLLDNLEYTKSECIRMLVFKLAIKNGLVSLFEQVYEKWTLSFSDSQVKELLEQCILYQNLECLKYINERYRDQNNSGLLNMLLFTHSPSDRVYNIFEYLSRCVNLTESHLSISIENNHNKIAKRILEKDKERNVMCRFGIKDEKLKNTYLLRCIRRNNFEMFYYLIDNKLVSEIYEPNIFRLMESYLIDTHGTRISTFTWSREARNEWLTNKEWWMRYLIFDNPSESKYKELIESYRMDVRNIVSITSDFPKEITNIIVEYI